MGSLEASSVVEWWLRGSLIEKFVAICNSVGFVCFMCYIYSKRDQEVNV